MGAKILVVDDDPNMRQLLTLHLGNAGYDVQAAEDGIAAGYKVLRQRPELIICDVNMPYMDGFEFVAALRQDPELRDIRVMFLSTAPEIERRGKELGAVGYLFKPVRADWLLKLVGENVEGGLVAIA
jgi:CheY-like chemotaxis protein